MAQTRQKSHSTSLPGDVDQRLREIATRENRSCANVIENSVRVFTLLPKGLRDSLIDATAEPDEARKGFQELARRIAQQDAWRRFDEAAEKVAAEIKNENNPLDDPNDYENAVVIETRP